MGMGVCIEADGYNWRDHSTAQISSTTVNIKKEKDGDNEKHWGVADVAYGMADVLRDTGSWSWI